MCEVICLAGISCASLIGSRMGRAAEKPICVVFVDSLCGFSSVTCVILVMM